MARSQFVWLLVYGDSTTKYVKAQTISQMMYCDEINLDEVINIIKIDIVDIFPSLIEYPVEIEIPFEN